MRRDSLWNRIERPAPTPAVSSADYPATTVRDAVQADRDALQRLAQLDSSTLSPGPVLVAEVDGELWAALSLSDGRAVADPFRPSAEVVGLLHERARHLQDVKRSAPQRLRNARSARHRPRRAESPDGVHRRLGKPT